MATTRSINTVVNIKQVPAAFTQANTAFASANNVAPQLQPAFDTANSAGLYANTAFIQANLAFNSANNVAPQIQPAFSTANSAALYANASFLQANAAFQSANNVAPQIQPAFSTANSAALYANGAFEKANSSLSNTNLNVSGVFNLLSVGGDEGGEIFFGKPTTNTSLSAGVIVDVYQNKLRIFENGGGIRGAFIDIANTTANGISSEITKYDSNNSSTGFLTLPIGTVAQRPANPAKGSIRYNSSNNIVEVYMPSAGWVTVAQDTFTLEYIAVAGGGGGGQWAMGGGGGAGGVIYSTSLSTPIGVAYTVTVGAGGGVGNQSPNGPNASPGSNSSIVAASTGTNVVALGGGAGGGANQTAGQPGGSGGGSNGGGVGTGLVGQGNPGGPHNTTGNAWGGGGGGAGATGGSAISGAGAGGIGVNYASFAPFSASGYFGGGGGGGAHSSGASPAAAPGGTGGGGTGGIFDSTSGQAGSTNTGGGGGGASGKTGVYGASGGAGGSGIVVIRYSGTTQRATGGTITTSGGYTYHLFTGSGTFNFTG